MHPELWQLGPVHVRAFGAMMAAAFLVGTWLGMREARRLGLNEDHFVNVILVALISAVIGARALYVIEHLTEFRNEWGSVFALWQGGLTLYGGVVAGTLGGLTAARRFGLPRWLVADALAPSLALGTMFGRVGCFLNGCCYGHPTTLAWGVKFPHDSFAYLEFGDTPVHPSQLYNAALGLGLNAYRVAVATELVQGRIDAILLAAGEPAPAGRIAVLMVATEPAASAALAELSAKALASIEGRSQHKTRK